MSKSSPCATPLRACLRLRIPIVTALLAPVLFSALGLAHAQEWPARPITMVIGTAAGGGSDIVGRALADRLGGVLGQPVIVENIGTSVAAASRVARAQPNGYVFDFGFASTHAIHPSLYKRPVYDAINDFTPVGLVVEQPFVVVARKDFPADGLREFAAYAKLNQAKLQYASSTGAGSLNHLSCELLNSAIGIKITMVPYRDAGLAVQDMLAGRIDYQCLLPATMIPQILAGNVKGIAVTGKERLPQLPDLATAAEQGLPGFDVESWYGFFLPKGVPDAIVRRLNAATNETMNTPAVQQRLRAISATLVAPERRSPEYLRKFVADEVARWAGPIKAAGLSLE
jgi:tripartite-type tricarboxylate transporter receptor subunit TctC